MQFPNDDSSNRFPFVVEWMQTAVSIDTNTREHAYGEVLAQ
jgi:hypothetical protein